MAAGPHFCATGASRQASYVGPVIGVAGRSRATEDVNLWSRSKLCGDGGIGRDWKQNGRRRERKGKVEAMIREVVTVGTAAATVTSSGGHHVVLRVALYTVTQVAVTAAVCYGAYLSPYAEGLKNRTKVEEDCPGECGV
jgi:hypothetical protein